MKVRITESITSSEGWNFASGQEVEYEELEKTIGKDVAKTWLTPQSGRAVPVGKEPETAALPKPTAAEPAHPKAAHAAPAKPKGAK